MLAQVHAGWNSSLSTSLLFLQRGRGSTASATQPRSASPNEYAECRFCPLFRDVERYDHYSDSKGSEPLQRPRRLLVDTKKILHKFRKLLLIVGSLGYMLNPVVRRNIL